MIDAAVEALLAAVSGDASAALRSVALAALALGVVGFLAATLLPVGSEPLMLAACVAHPDSAAVLWAAATLGNTLGSLTTYAMVRWVHAHWTPPPSRWSDRITALARHGPPTLALAWLPLVGDLLPALAGWSRWPLLACTFWIAVGKGARYAALVWLAKGWISA